MMKVHPKSVTETRKKPPFTGKTTVVLCDITCCCSLSLCEISPSRRFISLVVAIQTMYVLPSPADKPHNPMVNAGAIVISSLIKVNS